jgi:hypothetical protein
MVREGRSGLVRRSREDAYIPGSDCTPGSDTLAQRRTRRLLPDIVGEPPLKSIESTSQKMVLERKKVLKFHCPFFRSRP